MNINLCKLSIAALTAALSFPAAATPDTINSISTDISSNNTNKEQPTKLAMKCNMKLKCGMKCNEKDCGDCGGACGGNCGEK